MTQCWLVYKRRWHLNCSDHDVANCLNDFFTRVFTNEPAEGVPSLPDRSDGSTLQDIEITHQDILNQLGRLKINKSCGSDNCQPCVPKNVKEELVVPLYHLYSKSLKEVCLLLK